MLHTHSYWLQDGAAQLSTEGCLVVTLFQQWLVRHLCKQLMQLMTSEAFILYRNTLPSSYLENYISFHTHFSLQELILKYHRALEHSGWWVQCQYTTRRKVSQHWRNCSKYCYLVISFVMYPILQFYISLQESFLLTHKAALLHSLLSPHSPAPSPVS